MNQLLVRLAGHRSGLTVPPSANASVHIHCGNQYHQWYMAGKLRARCSLAEKWKSFTGRWNGYFDVFCFTGRLAWWGHYIHATSTEHSTKSALKPVTRLSRLLFKWMPILGYSWFHCLQRYRSFRRGSKTNFCIGVLYLFIPPLFD